MARKTTKTTTTVVTETTEDGRPSKTLVTFLLDRTGSMQTIKTDTIGGFNSYLDQLEREAGDLVEFTLLQFDSFSVDKLHVGAALKTVKRLTAESYQPRANTPLVDACVKAIRATEDLARARAAEHPRVVVVFQTDGEENCSREFTTAQLIDLIREKTLAGWEFLYLGANIDAYRTAVRFGIGTANTFSYQGHLSGQTMSSVASNTSGYARGASADMSFTAQQKAAGGDRFDPRIWPQVNPKPAPKRTAKPKPVVEDINIKS